MPDTSLAERIREARLAASLRLRRQLSQSEMAELVGKEAGQPLWQAQWSSYELGKSEPPLAVITAAARLSGLDPSYLAFGPPQTEQPAVSVPAEVANAMPAKGGAKVVAAKAPSEKPKKRHVGGKGG